MKNFLSIAIILYALPHAQAMKPYEESVVVLPKHQPLQVNSKFYCPPEGKDRDVLSAFSKSNRNAYMILIPKTPLPGQETLCMYEVKPILDRRSDENRQIVTWEVADTYEILYFFFKLWHHFLSPFDFYEEVMENNLNPIAQTIIAPIYNIVFHPSLEVVVATRHRISSTEYNILDYQDIRSQITNSVYELSPKPFCFRATYFLKIILAFQSYNSTSNPTMIKHKLVPEQDLAPLQNKATEHLINIAPLWDKLALLMAVINYGIHRADMQIKRKFVQDNKHLSAIDPSNMHELIIYTRLLYPKRHSSSTDLYIPDIWFKFVHYRTKKLGLFIYLHNTPLQPPREENKLCRIEERVDCNFNDWIENNDEGIENVQYAYCCVPTAAKIEKAFWLKDEIRGTLDIGKIAMGYTDIVDEPTSNLEPEEPLMEKYDARERSKRVITDTTTNTIQPEDSYTVESDVIEGQQIDLNKSSMEELETGKIPKEDIHGP